MNAIPIGESGMPQPWMKDWEIAALEDYLQPHWSMVEYGAGGSTVWLAKRVAHVYSIEHSSSWATLVSSEVAHHGIHNVSLSLIPVERKPVFRGSYPKDYLGAYRAYAEAIMTFPRPDAVLVDGRARLACMRAALQCLGSEGVLFLHDFGVCGRERYDAILDEIEVIEIAGTLAMMRSRGTAGKTILLKPE